MHFYSKVSESVACIAEAGLNSGTLQCQFSSYQVLSSVTKTVTLNHCTELVPESLNQVLLLVMSSQSRSVT